MAIADHRGGLATSRVSGVVVGSMASTDPPACPLLPPTADSPQQQRSPNLKTRLAVEYHDPHDVPSGNTWPAQWQGEEVKVGRRDGP